MDISQGIFFQYTMKQLKPEYCQAVNVAQNFSVPEDDDYQVKEGEISINNVGSTLSDNAIEEIMKGASKTAPYNPLVELSTTYKSFTPAEISNIKQVIFNLHNKSDDVTPEEPENPDTPQVSKKSFISEFCDADTLFEYINTVNPEITKETGISKAQLVTFTQADDWEDSHYDFFGSLNRVFSQIDKDNDGKLSYSEINEYIGEELGESFIQYKNKVNSYCDEIQAEYETLTNQKKLEFALEKTEEYLQARNMQPQLDALNRLKGQTDLYNTIKVGQIAIADLNKNNTSDYITLGAYNYWAYTIENYDNGINVGDFEIFSHDRDNNEFGADLGITLDISLLDENWYILVNTLVHELTHATAYRYYSSDEEGGIPKSTVTKLYEQGAIDEDEYNWYINNWNRIVSPSSESDRAKLLRLDYLAACVWGEYAAYQEDADYNDSIGQDVYQTRWDGSTTAVVGPDEKQTIMNHIEASYNYVDDDGREVNESIPDYKWWSYA